jgi:tRNA wybutosine-synthesizing protein 2
LIGKVLLLQGVDAIVVDQDAELLRRIGEAYMAIPQHRNTVKTVAMEIASPHGELRVPTVRVIAGEQDTSHTVHVEGGIRYCLDPTRVMFCSGNVNERMHFRDKVNATREIVVDMFAGIGYFTIPLARSRLGAPSIIYAMELNPESAQHLQRAVRENKVETMVTVLCGDNRDAYVSHCANRVLMGYIPTPVQFVDRALDLLCHPQGGIVHYHYVALESEKHSMPLEHFCNRGWDVQLLEMRVVKSYAPQLWHCVADLRCVPNNLVKITKLMTVDETTMEDNGVAALGAAMNALTIEHEV